MDELNITEPQVDNGLTPAALNRARDVIEGKDDIPFLLLCADSDGMLSVVSRSMTNGLAKEMLAVFFNRLSEMEKEAGQ